MIKPLKDLPILQNIKENFPAIDDKRVIIAYGDSIYTDGVVNYLKVIHENTHLKQQKELDKDKWWDKYIADPEFRLSQEVEAYSNEAKAAKETIKDRNTRYLYIRQIILDISSEMYGNIISYEKAKKLFNKY